MKQSTPDLKPGQIMVGLFMRKPAKAWRIMGSSEWAIRYIMPDGSTIGPYVCYPSELANMQPFPGHDEIFGKLGYFQRSIYDQAVMHAVYLQAGA